MIDSPEGIPRQTPVAAGVNDDGCSVPPGSVRRVLITVAATLMATASVLAMTLVLIARADWWQGLLASSVVMALAGVLSLAPLVWGLQRQLMHAVAGYFVAAGVRLVVALGGCLLAILAGGYPAAPTLLLMVVYYLAILAAESAVVARVLWKLRA
jgi:hypothetical protein